MDAKLNDKNLQALEAAKMGDMDLGMTTPALLSAPSDAAQSTDVKKEFPTLPLLDEQLKAAKNAYLVWVMPNTYNVLDVVQLYRLRCYSSAFA